VGLDLSEQATIRLLVAVICPARSSSNPDITVSSAIVSSSEFHGPQGVWHGPRGIGDGDGRVADRVIDQPGLGNSPGPEFRYNTSHFVTHVSLKGGATQTWADSSGRRNAVVVGGS
jgi:hypothetical protein